MDISSSDSNEQHVLDRKNKHVHKSGGKALRNRKSCCCG